ncbi:hypothetical protein FRC18_006035, partial [Serendipita sp. 400]
LWGPQGTNQEIGNIEGEVISYCTKPGRGTRLFPDGTIISAHFVETPDFIQVTGTGNFVNIGIKAGDNGGELDPHGAEGPQAATWCQHVYDINGCRWNMPANYDAGFETCQGDSGIPMGLYPQEDGSTSTYQPRATPVPDAHPAPASSGCQTFESTVISNGVPIQTITATTFSTSVRSITTRIGSTSSTVVTPSQSSSLPRPSSSSPAPTSNNSNANNSNGTVGQSISLVSILVGGVLALCTLF